MKVMVIVKATRDSEAGVMPSEELLTRMGQFNEDLVRDGLHPSAKGVRVSFPSGAVTNGPFPETGQLISGFWLWRVQSMQEAIDWIRRSPFQDFDESEVEIRPVFEADDFGEALTPELRAQEARILAEANRNQA
jgi:hypothetical protein